MDDKLIHLLIGLGVPLPLEHTKLYSSQLLQEGWDRYLSLPLSGKAAVDASNHGQGGWEKYGLVLDKSASGWDAKHVNRPCVIRVGDEYYMYYSARDLFNDWRIGLAIRSDTDPKGTFTREEEKFFGWYEGRTNGTRHIIKCESTDGKSWSGFTKVYDLDSDDQQPWVLRIGSLYYCVYFDGATDTIHLLTSNDGVTWEDYGQIIGLGGAGDWDEIQVNYCNIFWSMGVWYAFYQGRDSGGIRRFGIATSSDGFTYTKYPKNPIIALGETGDYDQTFCTAPTGLLYVDGSYYLWYNGFDGTTYRILLAYMPV